MRRDDGGGDRAGRPRGLVPWWALPPAVAAGALAGVMAAFAWEGGRDQRHHPDLMTRTQFEGKVIGRNAGDVYMLVGDPDLRIENTAGEPVWVYKRRTYDLLPGQFDEEARVRLGQGKNYVAVAVEYVSKPR